MTSQEKRARQRANRDAARAAREAEQKRQQRKRSLIRGGIAVVIVGGLVVLFSFLASRDDGDDAATTDTTAADATTTTAGEPFTLPEGCTDRAPADPQSAAQAAEARNDQYPEVPPLTIDPAKTYTATFDTTCGEFTVELDAAQAPQTVNAFVFLAREGFYTDTVFHRIVKDFVVQGGDPTGTGSGGPGFSLPDEPPSDGYAKYDVAMANSGPGTTGSQFFLVTTDEGAQSLAAQTGDQGQFLYSTLGTVTQGQDVVDKLGQLYNRDQTQTDLASQRTEVPVYLFSVTIAES